MALGANELYEENDKGDTSLMIEIQAVQPKTLAAGAGDDVDEDIGLPALTPMAVNSATKKWVPWDANGANDTDTIRGLLSERTVLDVADEVIGNVVMRCKVHYNGILAAVEERGVEVAADLVTELANNDNARTQGILVYGLAEVK
jgi:hypothetical protein